MGIDLDSRLNPVKCDRCPATPYGDNRRELIFDAWSRGWYIERDGKTKDQESGKTLMWLVLCPRCADEAEALRLVSAKIGAGPK